MKFDDISLEKKEKLLELIISEFPDYMKFHKFKDFHSTVTFNNYLFNKFYNKKENEFLEKIGLIFDNEESAYVLVAKCFDYFGINVNDICQAIKNE